MRLAAIFLLCSLFSSASFPADVFVATLRAPAGSTAPGGHLYRVDAETGAKTFVGRILVDGTHPVGLTAMAFHPRTNVLYAITMGVNDAGRAALLTIDAASAEARVVGRLTRPLSDISFDPEGRLFGWTANSGQLARVDIGTGKVSVVGDAAHAPIGGAFAIDSRGNAYVAPWRARGTLDRVDLRAGTVSQGPALANLPDLSTVRSMAFSAGDELLAAQSVRNTLAASTLLRIDPATGQAIALGEIPEDTEAIAVAATREVARAGFLRQAGYVLLAGLLFVVAWLYLPARGRKA